jgi:dTDP-4-dehydrorhamnose reductase
MIVVFGGAGQLGRELVAAARGTVPLVALSRPDADITDPQAVGRAINRWRPRLVVNAAAYNQVDKAEREPEAAHAVNANGPRIVAAACAAAGVPILHISTDFVFDGSKDRPYVEDDWVAPLNAYGRSKAAGEAAVHAACRQHVILRTAWLFSGHGRNFLTTVLDLARGRNELRFVADQYGSPTAASDLARAILTVARSIALGAAPWGTYHFAGADEASRWDMANVIVAAQARITGRRPAVEKIAAAEYSSAATRPMNSALDSSRFAVTFGFRAGDWRSAAEEAVVNALGMRIAV